MKARKKIGAALDRRIREEAKNRCGYCLAPQRYVLDRLEVEHIIPIAEGGTNEESNLWLSCGLCNGHKGIRISGIDPVTGEVVPLFNPRTQIWSEHFKWSEDKIRVVGLIPIGRATVLVLQLDSDPIHLGV